MTERALPLVAVAAAAIGCSVLVNTDFTGGKEPAASNQDGQGGSSAPVEMGGSGLGSGGTAGDTGIESGGEPSLPTEGGAGNEPDSQGGAGGGGGTGGAGGIAGEPEGGSGADEGTGGSSGGVGGSAGMDASGGGGLGGTAGGTTNGGAGLGGGGGMSAGMSGAGAMTCDADLTSNPMHCGSCATVCPDGVDCIDGTCVTSPCAGICATWMTPDDQGQGPRKDFTTTDDQCVEVRNYAPTMGYLASFNCWYTTSRLIEVNGAQMTCDKVSRKLMVPLRAGGYCVHATMGTESYAGFIMPLASDCCKAPP